MAVAHDWPEIHRAELVAALQRALTVADHVRAAWLFGSFARGGPFRDIDVAVWFAEPWTWRDLGRLSTQLWLAAGSPPVELDLVPLNDAPPRFQLDAIRSGVVLGECWPGAATEAEAEALAAKLDMDDTLRVVQAPR